MPPPCIPIHMRTSSHARTRRLTRILIPLPDPDADLRVHVLPRFPCQAGGVRSWCKYRIKYFIGILLEMLVKWPLSWLCWCVRRRPLLPILA